MAKTKRKKTKKRLSFRPGSLKEKKKKPGWFGSSLVKLLKVSSVICALLAIAFLIYIADKKYIKSEDSVQTGPVVLMDTPEWVGDQLKAKILSTIGTDTVMLDDNAASFVAEKLSRSPWLADFRAETTDDSVQVHNATYRKPIAVVESGITPFYVDIDRYVMDYVPMPHLLIVEIKGLSLARQVPRLGEIWERDDLEAAIVILGKLILMDITDSPDKPLLREIASIDVSNFQGNQNDNEPHIVLYSQDNTPIIWGAEFGAWQTYLESTDEQKLAKLYGYYKEMGTLNVSSQVKFINLCDPRVNIPLPIDKY